MWDCSFCVDSKYIDVKYNLDETSLRYMRAKFDTKEDLEEHKKSEEHKENKKKLYCESCKFQYMSPVSYWEHYELKHKNKVQFKCECCDVSFDFKSKLNEHLNTQKHKDKESGKEEEILDCETCCYHAANKHKLEQHYRTQKHQDKVNGVTKQEYKCCGFSFKYLSDYNRHINSKHHSSTSKIV